MGIIFTCVKNSVVLVCKLPFLYFGVHEENPQVSYIRTKTKSTLKSLPIIPEKPEYEYFETSETQEDPPNSVTLEMKEIPHHLTNFEEHIGFIDVGKEAIELYKSKIQQDFNGFEMVLDESNKETQLKIRMKTYCNSEGFWITVFYSEFVFPCAAKKFLEFVNDFETQKSLTKNYDEYSEVENFHKNFGIYYICYSKSLITSARDFLYLKHNTQEGNVIYDVSKSIELKEKHPVYDGVVRGEILISGYEIKDLEDNHCSIKLYSETDFKIKISPALVKKMSVKELKNYIENSLAIIKNMEK